MIDDTSNHSAYAGLGFAMMLVSLTYFFARIPYIVCELFVQKGLKAGTLLSYTAECYSRFQCGMEM